MFHNQTAQFVSVVAQNLPEMSGDIMQGWIENPSALQKALRSVLVPSQNGVELKVFKTIKLGTSIQDADGFRKAINETGIRFGDWVADIMFKTAFTIAVDSQEVDLVVISVAELGFKKGASLNDIFAKAKERGLELCPNEIGPQLRLQYADQPMDEWLIIGMEPFIISDDNLRLFFVGRDGDIWLGSCYYSPKITWSASSRFVFVLPRK